MCFSKAAWSLNMEKAKSCHRDTDSIIAYIKTEDIFIMMMMKQDLILQIMI